MASMIQSSLISDDQHSPIRALHSLREAQVSTIAAGLKNLVLDWAIERHESCDGHLSLMLIHAEQDATIVVDREPRGIFVSLVQGDELQVRSQPCLSEAEAIDAIKVIVGEHPQSDARHTA